ncbi:hypothetical protein BDV96DRAFT_601116 [Lophiotrema nucula]|uniref:Extracellular membrane protein CFEM domain-containing protein n=1 Tax=Lophiotrema nucula TaxID=690887 RepID=A0A6A5Z5N5_9PLEO|nr:hypothetical protein BDV96DRAFT_601116 [Lophiotrema nucula]
MKSSIVFSLFLTSTTLASPLVKRWACGLNGDPPAYACAPNTGCKDEIAWGNCAFDTGLTACNDPAPSTTQPVSACQSAAFAACDPGQNSGNNSVSTNGTMPGNNSTNMNGTAPPVGGNTEQQGGSGISRADGSMYISLMIFYLIWGFELL